MQLESGKRYVQFAFNSDINQVRKVLSKLPQDEFTFIEAGTPYIKQYGMEGIKKIRERWNGTIIADLKVVDGASNEVEMAKDVGATGISALGTAPIETLNLFTRLCNELDMVSFIDMIGVKNPLKRLLPLRYKPDIILVKIGRDEEQNTAKIIQYKEIKKIKSKFGSIIAVAGGLTFENFRSAYFNGADLTILNIVNEQNPNSGVSENEDFDILMKNIAPILRNR